MQRGRLDVSSQSMDGYDGFLEISINHLIRRVIEDMDFGDRRVIVLGEQAQKLLRTTFVTRNVLLITVIT
ncbi:hypothetical protein Syun_012739 [Stephania yunnanensis]|uniref:Uncharacterized protein n=1 Tax=Stephania yunnanensis TaxID=152371 RepID=A0AAP0K0T6_9MAGN